nr:MAG TPA: hypothetical protein [Caudoviricetes sp.]
MRTKKNIVEQKRTSKYFYMCYYSSVEDEEMQTNRCWLLVFHCSPSKRVATGLQEALLFFSRRKTKRYY